MTVRIVTDSACDLPDEIAAELGIEIVPLTIRFGEEEFVDRRDLTPSQFWSRCAASSTLPETAAPAPGQFEATYRALAESGASGVLVVCMSRDLSATIASADVAAQSFTDVPVTVVDSRSVTLGLGAVVAAAARQARDGADLATIAATTRELANRTKVWGALDTLDNLKKGGRIGNARAMLASVLSIKPIIEVRDGRVEEGGKQRTRSKALSFLIDKVHSYGDVDNLSVLHADCTDVDAFVARLSQGYSGDVMIGQIGPVVGSHAGVGTIGVAFTTK